MDKSILFGAAMAASLLAGGAAQAGAPCQGSACYKLVHTPPAYATVSEKVLVRPAHTVARRIPAKYGQVRETVVVRPERTYARHIPAVYGTKAETVLVEPARKEWQVSRDYRGKLVGCWVVVPARYATVHRKVVIREAGVVHETVPAVLAERSRLVVARPASMVHETIPPVYGVRHREVMVHPGSKAWVPAGRHY